MKRIRELVGRNGEKGQSLVELALFMPIFIIILAGLAEVSQIVLDQNRVSNAARSGARFLANGGDDKGMTRVALNVVTQTLSQDESVWDIWSIRAKVNGQGNAFSEWEFDHVFGISNTTRFSTVVESQVQSDVLTELRTGGDPATADLRIVGTLMLHDFDSILGLDAIPYLGTINSVRALNVMRIIGLAKSAEVGCNAFPIAIHEGIRSVTPPGQGSNPYPDNRDFGAHSPKPKYRDFVDHTDNVPLEDAQEGDIFKIQNGFGSGNFGWLRWNTGRPDNEGALHGSLKWPGNSNRYTPPATDGSGLPGWGRVHGYVEPGDVTDSSMHIGDWVAANTGAINSREVRDTINDHIQEERVLRVIIWSQSVDRGNYGEYRIIGFALFRLRGYNLSSGSSWILAEFIGWDDSCGQT
jgi:Flp pilus assembly protein TadG